MQVNRDLGRHAYGVAAIVFGATTLYWRDVDTWPQIRALGDAWYLQAIVYIAAAAAVMGGIAIQWRAAARAGSVALGVLYLFFAVLWIPRIVATPLIYDRWGNFFEQFSLFSGALIAYAALASSRLPWAARAARIGRLCFGVSVISFALEQAFYLRVTADFVPKWIPPGQTFWAVATTIAFALAAVAILSGWRALLASQLLTAMILLFGVLIWLPRLFADPRSYFNWSENAENLAIAGVAWILADYLWGAREKRTSVV